VNFPRETLRQAYYDALNGNISRDVYSTVPESKDNYVLVGDILIREDSAQSFPVYDTYTTIEIVTRLFKRGGMESDEEIATEIDSIIRPTVTGFLTIPGWEIIAGWLEESDQFTEDLPQGKINRITMEYYIKIAKS
jgi:hypothetical protein